MSTDPDYRKIGPFQLEGRLGVGGMGIVYKATYLKGGQKVALKVLSPDLTADAKVTKRFEREMEILKKLKHPNIIKYYGGSASGTQRFYAMELIASGSLDELLRRQGKLSWEQTIDYSLQIAKALEHAHSAAIIHRDLKPANLLISSDGTLKLSDFGIARDTQSTALTQAGKTVGTMAYMAPEQITGKSPITRRTDLYALGCVIFQMLTGRTPFESETQPELLFKHIEEAPPNVREYNIDCPIWLDRLVQELLSKDPDDRPFDALAVQVMLEDVRKKVRDQESIVRATVTGGQSALTLQDGAQELTKTLGKKKSKKKRSPDAHAPFYERAWFLSLSLAVVVGLGVWWAWPASEEERFDAIQVFMTSTEESDRSSQQSEIEAFLVDFPETDHRGEAESWLDEIELIRAKRRLSNLELRSNVDPRNEGERLYLEARRYEKDGDRLTALERYEAMIVLLEDKRELKPYLTMAGERIREIHSSLDSADDPLQFVRRYIAEADGLYQEGKTIKARERWKAVVSLYRTKPEYKTLVEWTTARLDTDEPAAAIRRFPVSQD
ncbi:MAG: serine/threonine-protein kinase [Planctomycetaceae bacterium]